MQEEKIESLYQTIVKSNSETDIEDYIEFLSDEAGKLTETDQELNELVDKVVKKMLTELKNNIKIEMYDSLIVNLGKNSNQDGFDFAIGVIKTYYINGFIINGRECSTQEIMLNIIEEYKTEDTLPMPKIGHYIFASLFKIHYVLYGRNQK